MRALTTLDELARGLAAVRGSVRMGYRKGTYVCAVEFVGGSATFSNTDLPIALGAALCFLYQHNPRTVAIEPVQRDPDGARVGPAPTGTRVGTAVLPSHCAGCGWGEVDPGDDSPYVAGQPCPRCGETETCSQPNNHEGNHDLEGS